MSNIGSFLSFFLLVWDLVKYGLPGFSSSEVDSNVSRFRFVTRCGRTDDLESVERSCLVAPALVSINMLYKFYDQSSLTHSGITISMVIISYLVRVYR